MCHDFSSPGSSKIEHRNGGKSTAGRSAMGRLASDMSNGEIDSAARCTGLSAEAAEMVNLLDATSDALEDLTFVSIHIASSRPNDIDNALQGTFRLRDEYFTLSPPVDWWDEPYRGPNERGVFH